MHNIRVNYLYEEHPGDWSSMYNHGVRNALKPFDARYIDFTGCDFDAALNKVRAAPECDVWYVFSIGDRILQPLLERFAGSEDRLVIHNHGGMETGDYEALLLGPCDTKVFPSLLNDSRVHVLFNSASNLCEFVEFYGEPRCSTVVGFPLNVPSFPEYSIRRGIAVCGRPSIGKQVFLAAGILAPFKEMVTFFTGRSDYVDMKAVLKSAGFRVKEAHGLDYYEQLSQHSVGFTATLADSFGITNYEMVALGMPVVVPSLAVFRDFPESWKYAAYDVGEARIRVMQALEGAVEPPDLSNIFRDRFEVKVQSVLREMSKCT